VSGNPPGHVGVDSITFAELGASRLGR
jgi:hypothetical protein